MNHQTTDAYLRAILSLDASSIERTRFEGRMDTQEQDELLALLTDEEIVALAWCGAFWARPEQLLPE